MSPVPNIEDVETVEVGRFYMVPTVIQPWRPKAIRIVPVVGPLHEDARFIKFPDLHWHPDRRFVTQQWLDAQIHDHWAVVLTPNPRRRLLSHLSRLQRRPVFSEPSPDPQVIDGGRRRLKCRRLIGSFVAAGRPPSWLKDLEPAYANQRLRDGHVCPHRGISCRGVVAENDGVVCPGHGLKWDLETGRLVSRLGQQLNHCPQLSFGFAGQKRSQRV